MDEDKKELEALNTVLASIEREFGKNALMKLGDKPTEHLPTISTGSLAVDISLGGGIPRGRIGEIYGPEGSGKTTLCYHMLADVQAKGGRAAFIDSEHAMDSDYAKNVGVNVDELFVSQPDYGEQALEIAKRLTQSGVFDLIVIDSVAALTPKAEIEGQIGDSHVGLQARMMSQAMRALASAANQTDTTVMFTNQLREKIGVMFGSPETTPGGRALKFYASVRLDIRRIDSIKDGTDVIGNKVRVKVVKNKVAPPFKQSESVILFGQGFDRGGILIELGQEKGLDLISKSGSYFSYGETRLGQGAANAAAYLKEHPELADEIEQKILLAKFPPAASEPTVGEVAAEPASGTADVELLDEVAA